MTAENLLLNKHNEKLNQLIDKVLNQILGRQATQIIYDQLESNHSIQRHEIAEKLTTFNEALEEYLGTGAFAIEKIISENLEENKDVNFDVRQRLLKLA